MKRLKKSLTVPTIIICTLGWGYFASQAIDNKDGATESDNVIRSLEDIKKNSIEYKYEQSYKNIQSEYERLKEEERKRLEELERQRLEKLERIRLAKIEEAKKLAEQKRIAEQKKIDEQKKQQQVVSRWDADVTGWVDYQFTHFTAYCPEGCSGTSASGIYIGDSNYYQGYRVIAAPKNIPLYSIVRIKYPNGTEMDCIVLDRGGAIKGKLLDVLVSSESEARRLGRVNGQIKILRYGKDD